MFKKFSNKQLSIVLAALTGLYALAWAFDTDGNQSFSRELGVIDTASVNKLNIITTDHGDLQLSKEGDLWYISDGEKRYQAAGHLANSALGEVSKLTATQLVANKEDQWAEYEVDEDKGIKVKITDQQGEHGLVIGKFQYQQSGMMTYIRPAEEKEVYLVEGFLNTTFNRSIDDWRDKTLVKGPNSSWRQLSFTYPADSSFIMFKGDGNRWFLPDSTELDVTEVNRYINQLTNINGNAFVEASPSEKAMELNISTDTDPVVITAFSTDSTYYLTSSLNPDAVFEGEGIWERIFIGLNSLKK